MNTIQPVLMRWLDATTLLPKRNRSTVTISLQSTSLRAYQGLDQTHIFKWPNSVSISLQPELARSRKKPLNH
ncbi:hypothetical protein CCL07_10125 [Pseudomonas congelans]|nr:hypothetical protein CCL07_20810 [Pseudomonas congelans]PBQ07320.1 hypothetical protein CCL07_10125 [Pseudomonas congelans]